MPAGRMRAPEMGTARTVRRLLGVLAIAACFAPLVAQAASVPGKPTAPKATTGGTAAVHGSSATLIGTVDPGGAADHLLLRIRPDDRLRQTDHARQTPGRHLACEGRTAGQRADRRLPLSPDGDQRSRHRVRKRPHVRRQEERRQDEVHAAQGHGADRLRRHLRAQRDARRRRQRQPRARAAGQPLPVPRSVHDGRPAGAHRCGGTLQLPRRAHAQDHAVPRRARSIRARSTAT